jgi:hypothetical protein
MGKDGFDTTNTSGYVNPYRYYAYDAAGYSLSYFNNDYDAIGRANLKVTVTGNFLGYMKDLSTPSSPTPSNLLNFRSDLFNGNIGSMVTTLPTAINATGTPVYTNTPQGYAYKYDQLNRLVDANAYQNLDPHNYWKYETSPRPGYRNWFEYDENGNIKVQQRADVNNTLFDDLEYRYEKVSGQIQSNRLYHVNDAVNNSSQNDDIVDQGNFNTTNVKTANNYQYDELGNLVHDTKEEISQIKWTVTGKISKIVRLNTSSKPDLEFKYDANGTRIQKIVKPVGSSVERGGADDPTQWTKTNYVHDASGNTMAVYEEKTVSAANQYNLVERYLYGSSRLGLDNNIIDMYASNNTGNPSILRTHYLTNKQYEITNHLGNVIATISDRKVPVVGSSGTIDHYLADINSTTDYYPFGAPIKERTCRWVILSSTSALAYVNATQPASTISHEMAKYRFSFNGQEKDDEVAGNGNHLSFNDFGLDLRLGRRFDIDPKFAKAPNESPYSSYGDDPIYFIDPNSQFKLNYTEKQLKENGLTKLDVVRFENIVNNIYNLVKDNPQAMAALVNTTGFSQEKIASDLKAGNGPVVDIVSIGGGAKGGEHGIIFDPNMIKALSNIMGSDKTELAEQTLGVALTILHEYGHHGDQVTNNGNNSGQYTLDVTKSPDGKTIIKRKYDVDSGGNNIKSGKQNWATSLTGHRGTDIETAGFGVSLSVDLNGKVVFEAGKLSPTTGGNIVIPMAPNSEQKGAVLETLNVK